ncbi:hypothetical protein [Streptomyces sp. NPDC058644]
MSENATDPATETFVAHRVEDARITGLDYVRAPQKLSRVEFATPLTPH